MTKADTILKKTFEKSWKKGSGQTGASWVQGW